MATVSIKRTEHYKIADYSFVELVAEVSDEFEDKKTGIKELHSTIKNYMTAARAQLKEEFEAGTFDL